MDVATLPIEVVDEVCDFLAVSDLLSLCITNTTFCASAQRLIFRNISLNSSRTAIGCLRSLSSSVRLAAHVRSFSLRLDDSTGLLRGFLQTHRIALSMMSNLESLDINLPTSASWVLLASKSAIYPRLTRLSCNFTLDASVSEFLGRAHALTQLQLGVCASNNTPMSSSPSPSLPRLHRFIGSCEDAVCVVPGHPLQVVHLHSGELNLGVLKALSQSTEPIEAFEAFNCPLTISMLSSIASNLPRLRHLRLMSMYHSYEQHDAVSSITSMPSLMLRHV